MNLADAITVLAKGQALELVGDSEQSLAVVKRHLEARSNGTMNETARFAAT